MKKFLSLFLLACIAWMSADVPAQIIQRDAGSTPSRTAMISVKSLDGNYSVTKETGTGTNVEFEVAGLDKGIYTVTLSVGGMNMETTKTILK